MSEAGQCPYRMWVLGSLFLFVAGCASSVVEAVKEQESDPAEVPGMAQPISLGSLWQPDNSRAYLFEDLRASRVGDIVIVKIVEQQKGSKSASTKADRESTYNNKIGGSFFGLNDFISSIVSPVGIEASTDNKFKGDASTSREDTLTGTIATTVVQVLPNGDLRVKGRREVTVNSEKQTMTLTGVVRRIDLDTQNTVLSTAIADAKIEYTGLGVVDDVQRPGWLVRLLDWIFFL